MLLDEKLIQEIRSIFEKPGYYNRKLGDFEVQEIADNLADFGESIIKFVQKREETKNETEPKV